MSITLTRREHEVCYQDMVKLVSKHAAKLTADEILAVAANMIGKLIALQDQRVMTKERALQILLRNLEMGNQQVIQELANQKSEGTA